MPSPGSRGRCSSARNGTARPPGTAGPSTSSAGSATTRRRCGSLRFTVGFDEALDPFVIGEDGRRRKTLPRLSSGDDAALSPAAYQRFSSMKKVARTAADQIRRLETAMVTLRRWTPAEFGPLFVRHPVI
ncbi:DUF4132 domain-containing protein [Actinomadura rubrisoli]|uniref:DUF4132 domain-containing protein n=1 Tax=Actinomadura rubrisoli TaxID=2530368 RepID=A0A4R5C880_9ACTN|nr:DUF4132 domain-containing protein [Actinomadura rubrisoli]